MLDKTTEYYYDVIMSIFFAVFVLFIVNNYLCNSPSIIVA